MAGELQTLLNPVAIYSMIATLMMALLSALLARIFGRNQSFTNKLVLFWLIWDALIHFTVEGPFVWLSLTGTVRDSDHFLSLLWKEYGKADKRWLVSDPTIVSIESLTVAFDGPLCILTAWMLCKNHPGRHFWQIVLSVCELYGGWMTFVPDILLGSPNLATDNWLYLWVYLVFYNGIWVVVPLLLLVQSWYALTENKSSVRSSSGVAASKKYNLRSKKSKKDS